MCVGVRVGVHPSVNEIKLICPSVGPFSWWCSPHPRGPHDSLLCIGALLFACMNCTRRASVMVGCLQRTDNSTDWLQPWLTTAAADAFVADSIIRKQANRGLPILAELQILLKSGPQIVFSVGPSVRTHSRDKGPSLHPSCENSFTTLDRRHTYKPYRMSPVWNDQLL